MSFDLTRYREHKASGLLKVEHKSDGNVVINAQQFDRYTGQPLDSIPVLITNELLQQVTFQKQMAQNLQEECDALLNDIYPEEETKK